MFHHSHPVRRVVAPFFGLALLVAAVGACGDDGESSTTSTSEASDATETTASPETTEPAASGDAAAVATSLCEAYGELDEPGGVDALLDLMSDEVTVTDANLGATLTGKDEIRTYVTGDAFAGIDTNECGATIQRGSWVAGAYALSSSSTGVGGQGIAAIHVTDGKVDRQINHYTPTDAVEAPPADAISESIIEDYCHAWDDGVDVDAVLSYLAPDAQLVIVTPIVGTDAIRAFITDEFDFDENDCQDEVVQFGEWAAGANGFRNSETGAAAGGVNIIQLDDADKIVSHTGYFDAEA